jgi:hypothetical protein
MLEDLKPPTRQFTCKVRTIAEELDAKDKEIFLSAVMDPDWKYKTLSNELAKRGLVLVDTTIKTHRIKACGCFRN